MHALDNRKDPRKAFWAMTDTNYLGEKYRIDQDLKALQYQSLETLKKIFLQYRFFTHYYIADMAILIGRLPFGKLRSILADILNEELGEGQEKNSHPELYDQFLMSIGVSEAELEQSDERCLAILQGVQDSLTQKSWAYGVGLRGMGGECLCQIYLSTMYDYFSQNPAILNLKDQISWTFWEIHIGEVDLHHQTIVRAAIDELFLSQPAVMDEVIEGYLESKTAWDSFWQNIFKAANVKKIGVSS